MKAHQQRVIDEKHELDARLGKLEAFIEGSLDSLPPEERLLIIQQHSLMVGYSNVLADRIALFTVASV